LQITGDTEALIDRTAADGNVLGLVSVPLFTNFLVPRLAAPPTLRNDPAVTICKANAIAERAMQTIEGTLQPPTTETPPASAPAVTEPDPDPAKAFVIKQVHSVMHTLTSPEGPVLPVNVERHATPNDVATGVAKFQLSDGASDVTSYHDFNSLQIAFENVWEEILDDRLGETGRQLYFQ
jgi:hypothetical protein